MGLSRRSRGVGSVARWRSRPMSSPRGAGELADFVEHLSVWAGAGIDAEAFLGRFDLSAGERRRVRLLRRLFAAYWVMRLLPGGSSHDRNPPGTLEREASACLTCSVSISLLPTAIWRRAGDSISVPGAAR